MRNRKYRPRWRGGPPDYMWWITVIAQLFAITLQIFNAIQLLTR